MYKLGLRSINDPRRDEFPKMMIDAEEVKEVLPAECDYTYLMPPVQDQSAFGVCVSFGTGKLFEFFYRKRHDTPIYISKRAIFSAIKSEFYPDDTSDDGAQVSDGLKVLEQFYVLNADMPFEMAPEGTFDQFLHGVAPNIEKKDFLLKNFVAVNTDVESLKYALFKHGVVALGMNFANEWMQVNSEGQLQGSNLTSAGGHCMCVVGYNDNFINLDGSKGAFLISNNWGTSYGKNGYIYLPYNVQSEFFPTDLFTVVA